MGERSKGTGGEKDPYDDDSAYRRKGNQREKKGASNEGGPKKPLSTPISFHPDEKR